MMYRVVLVTLAADGTPRWPSDDEWPAKGQSGRSAADAARKYAAPLLADRGGAAMVAVESTTGPTPSRRFIEVTGKPVIQWTTRTVVAPRSRYAASEGARVHFRLREADARRIARMRPDGIPWSDLSVPWLDLGPVSAQKDFPGRTHLRAFFDGLRELGAVEMRMGLPGRVQKARRGADGFLDGLYYNLVPEDPEHWEKVKALAGAFPGARELPLRLPVTYTNGLGGLRPVNSVVRLTVADLRVHGDDLAAVHPDYKVVPPFEGR